MTIIHLSEICNDNSLISPVQMLRNVADEIEAGTLPATKAVVLVLDDRDDFYTSGFRASNIKTSEMVSLLSVMMAQCVDWLRGRD